MPGKYKNARHKPRSVVTPEVLSGEQHNTEKYISLPGLSPAGDSTTSSRVLPENTPSSLPPHIPSSSGSDIFVSSVFSALSPGREETQAPVSNIIRQAWEVADSLCREDDDAPPVLDTGMLLPDRLLSPWASPAGNEDSFWPFEFQSGLRTPEQTGSPLGGAQSGPEQDALMSSKTAQSVEKPLPDAILMPPPINKPTKKKAFPTKQAGLGIMSLIRDIEEKNPRLEVVQNDRDVRTVYEVLNAGRFGFRYPLGMMAAGNLNNLKKELQDKYKYSEEDVASRYRRSEKRLAKEYNRFETQQNLFRQAREREEAHLLHSPEADERQILPPLAKPGERKKIRVAPPAPARAGIKRQKIASSVDFRKPTGDEVDAMLAEQAEAGASFTIADYCRKHQFAYESMYKKARVKKADLRKPTGDEVDAMLAEKAKAGASFNMRGYCRRHQFDPKSMWYKAQMKQAQQANVRKPTDDEVDAMLAEQTAAGASFNMADYCRRHQFDYDSMYKKNQVKQAELRKPTDDEVDAMLAEKAKAGASFNMRGYCRRHQFNYDDMWRKAQMKQAQQANARKPTDDEVGAMLAEQAEAGASFNMRGYCRRHQFDYDSMYKKARVKPSKQANARKPTDDEVGAMLAEQAEAGASFNMRGYCRRHQFDYDDMYNKAAKQTDLRKPTGDEVDAMLAEQAEAGASFNMADYCRKHQFNYDSMYKKVRVKQVKQANVRKPTGDEVDAMLAEKAEAGASFKIADYCRKHQFDYISMLYKARVKQVKQACILQPVGDGMNNEALSGRSPEVQNDTSPGTDMQVEAEAEMARPASQASSTWSFSDINFDAPLSLPALYSPAPDPALEPLSVGPDSLTWLGEHIHNRDAWTRDIFESMPALISRSATFSQHDAALVIVNRDNEVIQVFDSRTGALSADVREVIMSGRRLSVIRYNGTDHYDAWVNDEQGVTMLLPDSDSPEYRVNINDSENQLIWMERSGYCMTEAAMLSLQAGLNPNELYLLNIEDYGYQLRVEIEALLQNSR